LTLSRVDGRQCGQRIIQRDEVPIRLTGDDQCFVEGDTHRLTATLLVLPRARVIDQDVSHHTCGDREEMGAIMPGDALRIDQAQIRFVDEGRCLETVSRPLARHAPSRNLVQLTLDERNQSAEGALVALPPLQK
jgi:hypothetical protein